MCYSSTIHSKPTNPTKNMNIQTASAQLKTTFKKVRNTLVLSVDEAFILFHYETAIVSAEQGYVTINNGGFKTYTTKKFINRALGALNINAGISQRKGVWYFKNGETESVFTNSISFVPALRQTI